MCVCVRIFWNWFMLCCVCVCVVFVCTFTIKFVLALQRYKCTLNGVPRFKWNTTCCEICPFFSQLKAFLYLSLWLYVYLSPLFVLIPHHHIWEELSRFSHGGDTCNLHTATHTHTHTEHQTHTLNHAWTDNRSKFCMDTVRPQGSSLISKGNKQKISLLEPVRVLPKKIDY